MCSTGGPMADIDLKKLKTKRYRCLDCGNDSKALAESNLPIRQSDNVECKE